MARNHNRKACLNISFPIAYNVVELSFTRRKNLYKVNVFQGCVLIKGFRQVCRRHAQKNVSATNPERITEQTNLIPSTKRIAELG